MNSLLALLALQLPAFAALALAQDRHHEACFGHPPTVRRRRGLRIAGSALLLASLAWALSRADVAMALVEVGVMASVTALVVVALLAGVDRLPRR